MSWYKNKHSVPHTNKISFAPVDPNKLSLIQTLNELKELPENVKQALITISSDCQDQYALSYLYSIPQAYRLGVQIDDIPRAIKAQILYIYSNLQDYPNENVKNVLADYADVKPEDRFDNEDDLYF